jgi:hypothetical protein
VGTGHTEGGHEIVHSVTLRVDGGPEAPVGPEMIGKTIRGHKLTVLKHSTIWKFDCTAEVTVTDDCVYERTKLRALADCKLNLLYYFMHCFQPTTTTWLAELPDGTFAQGDLNSDGKMKINKNTRWAAQYDPTTGLGFLCYTPKVISGPGSLSMIWDLDAKCYHKYYVRANEARAFKRDDELGYTIIVKIVKDETGDFAATKAAARELEKEYPPVELQPAATK